MDQPCDLHGDVSGCDIAPVVFGCGGDPFCKQSIAVRYHRQSPHLRVYNRPTQHPSWSDSSTG